MSQAISSVLQQTFTDFELIVVDDGSTDNSVHIVEQFAMQDNRIRHIIKPTNEGAAYALKIGYEAAKGEYVCQVDSDDMLQGPAFEKTVAVLDFNPDCGMVHTNYQDIDEFGKILGPGWRCSYDYDPMLILRVFMTFHFRMIRKSVYEEAGGIDLAFDKLEDYELCLRISEITKILKIHEFLYLYRNHPNSVHNEQHEEVIRLTKVAINEALVRRRMNDEYELDVRYRPTYTIRKKTKLGQYPLLS